MTPPLVIAHVLSSFDTGGQERVALDLARRQCEEGHTVHAVSLAARPDGPGATAFRRAGVSVRTIAKRGRLDLSLPFRLAAHFRRTDVSVVHTHNPHALIYGAPAGRLASAVVIHSKHGMNPDTPRRKWLRRMVARLAHAYVAVTPSLGVVALSDADCDDSKLFVIPNGIDIRRFVPNDEARRRIREELGIPAGAWVVGTVGRLSPEKNQALLVDALAPLLGEQVHLVIVGDGPERATLLERVQRTGRGRHAHLVGARSDVEDLLASFDAFALTSLSEGLPLVLLEAMSSGVPVVSTAVGGVPDLVEHGVTGLLSDSEAREQLASQLSLLHAEPALSRRIRDAARHEVHARHSLDKMAKEYGDLYLRALHSRLPPGPSSVFELAGIPTP